MGVSNRAGILRKYCIFTFAVSCLLKSASTDSLFLIQEALTACG